MSLIHIDKEMHDIMVKPLPAGCRLTALYDCCHSGSALALPYEYVCAVYMTDFREPTD
jgi:hypothetical protein